jgi:hypothetical protein
MDSFFSDSTALYFYSAVFQGNMALIALAGIFAVYALQQNSQRSRNNDDKLQNYVHLQMVTGFFQDLLRPWDTDAEQLFRRILFYQTDGKITDGSVTTYDGKVLDETHPDINEYYKAVEKIKEFRNSSLYLNIISERSLVKNISKSIITDLRIPFLWTASVILLSLIWLPFANELHRHIQLLEAIPMVILIILDVIALILNARYVYLTLQATEGLIKPQK